MALTAGQPVRALAHLLALPLGLLLAFVLTAVSAGRAVHVELADTMYVVAHFHLTVVLGACLGVASFVAHRWGRFNAALLAGWGFLLLRVLADLFVGHSTEGLPDPGSDSHIVLMPTDPSMSSVSLASACASLLALVTGLCISFARRPRVARWTIGDTGAGS